MRTRMLLLGLTIAGIAHAQVWCPSGAIWEYNNNSFMVSGCETRQYVGDTVIAGRPTQRIAVTSIQMNWLNNTLDTMNSAFYTSQDDGVVYGYDVLNSADWDTLYWFDAVPGDRWYPPGADSFCPGQYPLGMLQVTDTGHVLVNGQSLRFVQVAEVDQSGQASGNPYPILERLGAPGMAIPPGGCIASDVGLALRTYMDGSFPFYDTGIADMCIGLGVNEPSALAEPPQVVLLPDQSGHWLEIRTDKPISSTVVISDVLGKRVVSSSIQGTAVLLETSQLAKGMHVVMVEADGFRALCIPWVKH